MAITSIGPGAGIFKSSADVLGLFNGKILESPITFIPIGSITRLPREGNPEPHYHYDPNAKTSWNSVGLKNMGIDAFVGELPQLVQLTCTAGKKLRISLAPVEAGDIHHMLGKILKQSCACWISEYEINGACPNLHGHGILARDPNAVRLLLEETTGFAKQHDLALKIAPDTPALILEKIADIASAYKVRKIVNANTRSVTSPTDATGKRLIGSDRCGMAGAPLFEDMQIQVRILREHADRTNLPYTVTACGGIRTGRDLDKCEQNGATEVQMVTALLEEGPTVFQDALLAQEYA